jgi:hypothetical protein
VLFLIKNYKYINLKKKNIYIYTFFFNKKKKKKKRAKELAATLALPPPLDLLKKKRNGFSLWQYMRIDELLMSFSCQRLYLVVNGAQRRSLCCRPLVKGEGREMKWRKSGKRHR